MLLGNIKFDQIKDKFGYKLTEDDKLLYEKYYSDKADLSEKESCFHFFDIPRCITFKGEEAKKAILEMFTSDKIVKQIGKFSVYEAE